MKKLTAASLIAGLLASASIYAADAPKTPLPMNAGQGFSQEGLKRIDAFFADEIANNRMPGAVLAVAKNGKLSINDVEVTEPYIYAGNKPSEMTFDVTVPEGKIWVMGDHRGASADSRYHQEDVNKGFVPVSKVTGRVVAVIWPFKDITYIPKVDVLKK